MSQNDKSKNTFFSSIFPFLRLSVEATECQTNALHICSTNDTREINIWAIVEIKEAIIAFLRERGKN